MLHEFLDENRDDLIARCRADEGAAGLSGPLRGLSIARRAVEAMGGVVRAREVKGTGCVLTIDLPRCLTGRKAQ